MAIIYSYDGAVRLETPINIGSKRSFKLMEEDCVTLKFSLVSPLAFRLGDWCDLPGFGRFVLVEPYKPEYNTTNGGYDYELKLEAQHMKWRNKKLRFIPGVGGNECSFKLTATAAVHLEVIAANVASLAEQDTHYLYNGTKAWSFAVLEGVDASAKFISFENMNILDALTTVAETFDCEWWVDGGTVYLGKCGQTETRDWMDFSLETNTVRMTHSRSQEKLATRIIPFGSTRNISPRYRKDLVFTVTERQTKNGAEWITDSDRPLSASMFPEEKREGFIYRKEFPIDLGNGKELANTGADISNFDYITLATQEIPLLDQEKGLLSIQPSAASSVGVAYSSLRGIRPPARCRLKMELVSGESVLAINESYAYFKNPGEYVYPSVSGIVHKHMTKPLTDAKLRLTLEAALYGATSCEMSVVCSGSLNIPSDPVYGAVTRLAVVNPDTGGDLRTIEGVRFNPAYASSLSERNWLALPSGQSLPVGTMYRLLDIDESLVKSSYFTSRYLLYRKYETITKNGITTDRLMLPEAQFSEHYWIDVRPGLSTQEAVEDVVVFEDEYPKADCTVTEVVPFEAKETVENDDGTDSDARYTAYYVRDDIFTPGGIFKEKYRIPDTDLEIHFGDGARWTEDDRKLGLIPAGKSVGMLKHEGSGKLNGWTFQVNWCPDAPGGAAWEIVRDSGSFMPNDIIRPEVGDTFVITGYDTALVDDELVEIAEQNLKTKAELYVAAINEDTSTYECTMMCDWAEKNLIWCYPGARVNLVNEAFFPVTKDSTGRRWGRKSRIIGFEVCLDIPADNPVLTIGEKPSYSKFGEIQSQIDSLNLAATSTGYFGGSVKVGGSDSGAAMLSEAKAFAMENFLYKTRSDRTPYDLAVGGQLIAEGGARSRDFMGGMAGFGWATDERGNFDVESIRVRSYMEIAELVVNRLSAIEGDQLLTESDTIEEVTDHGDGTYTLKVHEKWEGYFTAQYENNVCKGIFNNITSNLTPGEGQQSMNNAVYYTSWFRVVTVNPGANTMDVILYPDEEVPAGRNFPPQPMMKFARWGNSGAETDEQYARRQSCLFLSSTEGRIVKLMRVTKPIIDSGNIAFTLGTLPEFLHGYLDENEKRFPDGAYVNKLFFANSRELDHLGRPMPEIVVRGSWSAAADYYAGDVKREDTNRWERSQVEYCGCQWLCSKTGTKNPPSWYTTDWTFYLGDPTFRVELRGGPAAVNPRKFRFTLEVHAEKGGQDVTAQVKPQDVAWTRESTDREGNPRTQSDMIWIKRRGGAGLSLPLTQDDLDSGTGVPETCVFTATVTLRDGSLTSVDYEV